MLAESAAGELIASEIEIRSGRSESFAEAVAAQHERRDRLFGLVDGMGLALAATGTHPWAELPRPADHRHARTTTGCARNSAGSPSATTPGACTSTWACAAPTGRSPSATGCASCCRCCSRSRPTRPSSTAATPACTRSAPRSSPAPSRAAASPARSSTGTPTPSFVGMLERTGTVVESTQLWWSVRPHHTFGTVEVRICDAQTRGEESFALAGLIAACIAQTALDYDEHGYDGAGSAARRPRDRGEPLAGDPPRDERQHDRLPPRRRGRGARRRSRGCSPGPSRPARSSASRSSCRSATAPSGRARRSPPGPRSRTSTARPWRRRSAPTPPMPRRANRRRLLRAR